MGDVASLRFVRLIGHRECDRVMLHVARRTQDSIVEAAAAPVSSNQPEFERSFARFCRTSSMAAAFASLLCLADLPLNNANLDLSPRHIIPSALWESVTYPNFDFVRSLSSFAFHT